MSTRILINGGTAMGKLALEYANAVLEAREKGRRLKAVLDSMSWGDDWVQVAQELGLAVPGEPPTDSDAYKVWAIISTAQAAVDVPAVAELSRLDQGG